MNKKLGVVAVGILAAVLMVLWGGQTALATTDCTFTTVETTNKLDADCTTDATIFVPDGFTLDGRGNSITAVDPVSGHFVGAVVQNGGSVAHVTDLIVDTDGLANVCDAGADRLRGIMFEGASGSITENTVQSINQGASGCQEGNAIEVRNAPFDGSHPGTETVEIAHNVIDDYQKSGIICNGDVECSVHHNMVGSTVAPNVNAANAVQIGFGAKAWVEQNHIAGNEFCPSTFCATSVLLFLAENGTEVVKNKLIGNSFCALFIQSDEAIVDNNKVFDTGTDCTDPDFGVINFGSDNSYTLNKVRGYDKEYFGVSNDPANHNIVIQSDNGFGPFWEDPIADLSPQAFQ